MIQISDTAQAHFRKLIEREALPGLGVRLSAVDPGTARADARLEFAEPRDLAGDEWAVDCEGFTIYVDAGSVSTTRTGRSTTLNRPITKAAISAAPKLRTSTPL